MVLLHFIVASENIVKTVFLLGVLSYLAQGTFSKRTFNNAKRQKWLRFALNHSPLNYVSHKMLKVSPLCRC